MSDKLRLLLFRQCNRNCDGCCNKDFDLDALPVENDFRRYKKVFLTGGEPMLKPRLVLKVINRIRNNSNAIIIMYTAKVDDLNSTVGVMRFLDGVTVTLHEQSDVIPFRNLERYIRNNLPVWEITKSLRLNVFNNVSLGTVSSAWKTKRNIKWIKNAPLPKGEVFKRLDYSILERRRVRCQ